MYKASEQIRIFIKGFECCYLKAYKNKGDKWTIGYGATFYENGQPVKENDVISPKRADELFNYHIRKFENDVNYLIKTPVSQNQFDALLSFAYNVGPDIDADTIAEGLGDSTLLKYVNANPDDVKIRAEFMKWISRGTIFENGLKRRRSREADIYFNCVYIGNDDKEIKIAA